MQGPLLKSQPGGPSRDVRLQRGAILAFAMMLIVALVSLSVHFAAAIKVERTLSVNLLLHRDTLDLAEAGLTAALEILDQDTTSNRDGLTDLWAQSASFPPYEHEGGVVSIESITDEERRLNANTLLQAEARFSHALVMQRLLDDVQAPLALVEEIADFISPDVVPSRSGVESAYYLSQRAPYPAKNRPLDHPSELLLVRSMTKERYWGLGGATPLRRLISVRPVASYRINLNTAEREVIRALSRNFTPALVDQILAERATNPFRSRSDLFERLPATESAFETDVDDKWPDLVDFRSEYFAIRVNAEKEGYNVTLEALVQRTSSSQFKTWHKRIL